MTKKGKRSGAKGRLSFAQLSTSRTGVSLLSGMLFPATNAAAQDAAGTSIVSGTNPLLVVGMLAVLLAFIFVLRQYRTQKRINRQQEELYSGFQLTLEELRQSEARYQLLADLCPTGIYLTNPQGECLFVNEQWSELTGTAFDTAKGSGWEETVHPDDLQRVKESWSAAVKAGEDWQEEFRFRHANGRIVWVWSQARLLYDEHNEMIGYIGTNTDITRLKEAESAISFSEAKYRAVVQAAALGIVCLDERGIIVSVNPAFSEISGYDDNSLCNRKLLTMLSGKHRELFGTRFNDLLSGAFKNRVQLTLDLRRRDGNYRTLSATLSKPCGSLPEDGERIIAVIEDITERLLLEEEMSHAEKLESVGLLAGGIAHEFNNILTGIIGNLSLAEMNTEEGSETFELITEAEKSANRAQKLTQRLLTFSKGGTPVTKTMPVDDVVQDAALFALHGSNAKCEFEFGPNLDYVNIDEGQFAQVIHNLVINADQAMPKGGKITVRLENCLVPDGNELGLPPGNYVRIDISDKGVGIPHNYLGKIFDPFFSTKETSSGLGLSTSYSIVKKHNGHIKLTSSVGRGSKFSIFLPAAESPGKLSVRKPLITNGERGKILVMDDERTVRDVTRIALSKLGFDVVEAITAADAVRIYRSVIGAGDSFEAVLLDLTIPGGRGGQSTLNELKSIDSDVKAIVMSGYSNDPVLSDYRSYGFCGMITKPFGFKELSEAISLAITGKSYSTSHNPPST